LGLPLAANATEMLPSISASANTVMSSFLIYFPPLKGFSEGVKTQEICFKSSHHLQLHFHIWGKFIVAGITSGRKKRRRHR
jgi:hypothetical protein